MRPPSHSSKHVGPLLPGAETSFRMMIVVRLPAVKNFDSGLPFKVAHYQVAHCQNLNFEGLDNNSGFDRITAEIPSKWLKSSFGVGCWRKTGLVVEEASQTAAVRYRQCPRVIPHAGLCQGAIRRKHFRAPCLGHPPTSDLVSCRAGQEANMFSGRTLLRIWGLSFLRLRATA